MVLHLDRLRRNRMPENEVHAEPHRPRRSSRWSVLSTTPTVVEHTAAATPAVPERTEPRRPTIKEVVRKHPRNITYASILAAAFIGMVAGWAVYLSVKRTGDARQDAYRGSLVVNGLFVVVLIILFMLSGRQFLFIYRLFRPFAPHQSPSLPPWLVGRPPTYREALRTGGRGTGDVEDGIIAQNESLPKYGETIGSTLLARSQSRGGAVEMAQVERAPSAEATAQEGQITASVQVAEEPVVPQADLGSQREAEARHIEEARRLQADVPGYSVANRTIPSGNEQEQWEDVALDRKVRDEESR